MTTRTKTIFIKAFDSDAGRVREFDFDLPASFDDLKQRVLKELDKKDPNNNNTDNSNSINEKNNADDDPDALIEGRSELYFNATLGDGVFLIRDDDHLQSIFSNDDILSDGDCIGIVVSLFVEGEKERCVLVKCSNKAIQGVEGSAEFLFKFCPARPGTFDLLKFACHENLGLSMQLLCNIEVSNKDGEYMVVENDRDTCRALIENNLDGGGMPVVWARLAKIPEGPTLREIIVEVMFQGNVSSGKFQYVDTPNQKLLNGLRGFCKGLHDLLFDEHGDPLALNMTMMATTMTTTTRRGLQQQQQQQNNAAPSLPSFDHLPANDDVVLMKAVTATDQPFEKPFETNDEVREHIIRCRATVPSILRLRMEKNPNNSTNVQKEKQQQKNKNNKKSSIAERRVHENYFVGQYLKGGDLDVHVYFNDKKDFDSLLKKEEEEEEENATARRRKQQQEQEENENENNNSDEPGGFNAFGNNNEEGGGGGDPADHGSSEFMALLVGASARTANEPDDENDNDNEQKHDDEDDEASTEDDSSSNTTDDESNHQKTPASHHDHDQQQHQPSSSENAMSMMMKNFSFTYHPTDAALVSLCKFCKSVGKKCKIDLLHPLINLNHHHHQSGGGIIAELGLSFSDSDDDEEIFGKVSHHSQYEMELEQQQQQASKASSANDEENLFSTPASLLRKRKLHEEELHQIKTFLKTRRYLRQFPQYQSQVGFHHYHRTDSSAQNNNKNNNKNNKKNDNKNDHHNDNDNDSLNLLLTGSAVEIVETLRLSFERKIPFVCQVDYKTRSIEEQMTEFEKTIDLDEDDDGDDRENENEKRSSPSTTTTNTKQQQQYQPQHSTHPSRSLLNSMKRIIKRKKKKQQKGGMNQLMMGNSSVAEQFFDMMKSKNDEDSKSNKKKKTPEQLELEQRQQEEEERRNERAKRRREVQQFAQEWEDVTGGADNTTEAGATEICGELAPLMMSWNPPTIIPALIVGGESSSSAPSSPSSPNQQQQQPPIVTKSSSSSSPTRKKAVVTIEDTNNHNNNNNKSNNEMHQEQMDPSCVELFNFLKKLPTLISNDTLFALDLCDAEKLESLLMSWTDKLSTPTLISFMHHCRAAISNLADVSPQMQLRLLLARCFRAHAFAVRPPLRTASSSSSSSRKRGEKYFANRTFLMQTLIATSIEGGGEFLRLDSTEEFEQLFSCYPEEHLPRHCFDEIVSYLTDNDPHALSTLFSVAVSQRPLVEAKQQQSTSTMNNNKQLWPSSSSFSSDYSSLDYLTEDFLHREIEQRKNKQKKSMTLNNNNNSNNTSSSIAAAAASTTTTTSSSVAQHREQYLRRQIRHSMDSLSVRTCVDFAISIEEDQQMMLAVTDMWRQLAWCVAALVQNPVHTEDDMDCSMSWKWLRRSLAIPSCAEELLLVLKSQGPSYAPHDVVVRAGSLSLSRDADPRLLLPVSIVMSCISEWVRQVCELTTIMNRWTWPPVYSSLAPTSTGNLFGDTTPNYYTNNTNNNNNNNNNSPFTTFSGTRAAGAMLLMSGGGSIGSHRTSPAKTVSSNNNNNNNNTKKTTSLNSTTTSTAAAAGGSPGAAKLISQYQQQQQRPSSSDNNNHHGGGGARILYRPSSSSSSSTAQQQSPSRQLLSSTSADNNNNNNNHSEYEQQYEQENQTNNDFHYESRRGSPPRGGVFRVPCPPNRTRQLTLHTNNSASSSSRRTGNNNNNNLHAHQTNPRLQALKDEEEKQKQIQERENKKKNQELTYIDDLPRPERKYTTQFRHLSGKSDFTLTKRKAGLDTLYNSSNNSTTPATAKEIIEQHRHMTAMSTGAGRGESTTTSTTPRNLHEALEEQKRLITESEQRMAIFRKETKEMPPTKDEISKSFIHNVLNEALTPCSSVVLSEKDCAASSEKQKQQQQRGKGSADADDGDVASLMKREATQKPGDDVEEEL